MSHWERLATQSQTYVESDYQKAGYRLVMEQVLYASDPRSRIAYELIVRHRKDYDALLSQLGMMVTHNPVSYTHLDVYKRQVQTRATTRRSSLRHCRR